MRRAAAFLALLLCLYWTGAQGESGGLAGNDVTQTEVQSEILGVKSTSDQTNITPDIWAELKELRDMAIEHRVELRKLEQENTAMQTRLTASEYKNAVLEAKINAGENEVKELQRENTVLETRMTTSENEMMKLKIENEVLKARMKTSEDVMEELKMENTDLQSRVTASEDKSKVLEARMNASDNEVEELKRQSAVLEARMNASENEVEELKRQIADQPKVAFSLGLTDSGTIGPLDTDITLKFSKVITNFGQGYSPTTGHFTAPVRGAYYFSFNILDGRSNAWRRVYLYHNDKRVLFSYNQSANYYESVSNSLVLQLEKGDLVYLVLPASYSVYDSADDYTFFNGFLVFPL